jgi:phosphoglycerate kinase
MKKLTVKDISLENRRLLMRVDFNVPLDENQRITDDKRIQAALPTINYVLDRGARLVLMSHLGRPKGKVVPEMSLKPVAEHLSALLDKPVAFSPDCVGDAAEAMSLTLTKGQVLLVENVRFHKEETENDPGFSQKLARLGDVYANDAFGSAHRAHASTVGVARFFDEAVSGFLMQKELDYLGAALAEPRRPFLALLGGAKIKDKIPVIEYLVDRVDRILIGGGMAYTFLKARGMEIGKSIFDETSLDFVRSILENKNEKFLLPRDCVITDRFDFGARSVGDLRTVSADAIPASWESLDIGPKTIEAFSKECMEAGTVVWNGPMGVFEIAETAKGTMAVARSLAQASEKGTVTIIGGGDSASAVKKAGVADKMSHVSTGGGASLEFLQGKTLPGVEALTNA